MNKELVIEHYLSQLDRELQALPTGQRAEIITEIRSHILDKVAADSTKTIQAVLNDMGTPREVAGRYLEQKGVKPWAPSPARNWLKWIAISFAAMVAFVIISTIGTIWYFSPLVEVDEVAGRVKILGGWIDVNENTEEVKIGSSTIRGNISSDDGGSIEIFGSDGEDEGMQINVGTAGKTIGEEDVAQKKVKTIKIPFNTAKLSLMTATGDIFKWDCKGMSAIPKAEIAAGVLTLDLNKANAAKCSLRIPAGVKTEIKGINGKMELKKPAGPMDIAVTNAKVEIDPDSSRVYDFEVKVTNGMHDAFERSEDKGALKVKVNVVNGVVTKE